MVSQSEICSCQVFSKIKKRKRKKVGVGWGWTLCFFFFYHTAALSCNLWSIKRILKDFGQFTFYRLKALSTSPSFCTCFHQGILNDLLSWSIHPNVAEVVPSGSEIHVAGEGHCLLIPCFLQVGSLYSLRPTMCTKMESTYKEPENPADENQMKKVWFFCGGENHLGTL